MFGYRRPNRAADGAAPAPPAPDRFVGGAVRDAEEIVCRAWESVLLERRDRMESAVQAALENCAVAYRRLAEAQRGGDPGEIRTAQADLYEALEAERRCSAAAQRVLHALIAELDLLICAVEERAFAALGDQAAPGGPEPIGRPAGPTDSPARELRSPAPPRLVRGPARLIRCLVRARAAGRRQL